MDASYITASTSSAEAFKAATLLKTLSVNALIVGEDSVGKKSLAHYILLDAPIFDASNSHELLAALKNVIEVVTTNLENSPNIKILKPDLSQDSNSLRKQVVISYFLQDVDDAKLISYA